MQVQQLLWGKPSGLSAKEGGLALVSTATSQAHLTHINLHPDGHEPHRLHMADTAQRGSMLPACAHTLVPWWG